MSILKIFFACTYVTVPFQRTATILQTYKHFHTSLLSLQSKNDILSEGKLNQGRYQFMFVVLAGGLLIILIAVVIAVVVSVTSAVAAETDGSED